MRPGRSCLLGTSVVVLLCVAAPVRAHAEGAAGAATAAFAGRAAAPPAPWLGDRKLDLESALPWDRLDAEVELSGRALAAHPELFGDALTGTVFGVERLTSVRGRLDLLDDLELVAGRTASLQGFVSYDSRDTVQQFLLAQPGSGERTPRFGLRAELPGLALETEAGRTFASSGHDGAHRSQARRGALRAEIDPRVLLGEEGAWWLPRLHGGLARTNGWERVADQRTTRERAERSLDLRWSGAHWLLGLGWSEASEAARKAGEDASLRTSRWHSITLGAWTGDDLSLWLWLGRGEDGSQADVTRTLSGNLSLDWRPRPGWKLSAGVSPAWERAPQAVRRRWTATTQLAWELPRRLDGPAARAVLRVSRSHSVERAAHATTGADDWTFGVALVLPTF